MPEPDPRRPVGRRTPVAALPAARRRVGRLAALWLGMALGATALVGALTVWHLIRRGRLLRDSLGSPRDVRLPELSPKEDDDKAGSHSTGA